MSVFIDIGQAICTKKIDSKLVCPYEEMIWVNPCKIVWVSLIIKTPNLKLKNDSTYIRISAEELPKTKEELCKINDEANFEWFTFKDFFDHFTILPESAQKTSGKIYDTEYQFEDPK